MKYMLKDDSVIFWCTGIEEDEDAVASLINGFLLDLSEKHKVFLHAYRLPYEDVFKLINPAAILERAEALLESSKASYFHLKSAQVNSKYFAYATESIVYYFEDTVEWSDFLATRIDKPTKLIKEGLLSAYFASVDQGADFWFESNRVYEQEVLRLFEHLSNLGYIIRQSSHLSFP